MQDSSLLVSVCLFARMFWNHLVCHRVAAVLKPPRLSSCRGITHVDTCAGALGLLSKLCGIRADCVVKAVGTAEVTAMCTCLQRHSHMHHAATSWSQERLRAQMEESERTRNRDKDKDKRGGLKTCVRTGTQKQAAKNPANPSLSRFGM